MSEIKERLIKASNDGNFLEVVCQSYFDHDDNRKSVGQQLAFLHNEGKIDVITEFKRLTKDIGNTNFFSARSVFGDALPELKAPVLAVMDCLKYLAEGNDMAADLLFNQPFTKFCEADTKRPKELLKIAENSDGEWDGFISLGVILGSNFQLPKYVNRAIELLCHEKIEIRIQAVFAIGRINYRNDTSLLANALKALENVIQAEYDDRLFGTALESAFYLYLANNDMESEVAELIQTALIQRGDFVLHTASKLFVLENNKIPLRVLDILLEALKDTKPQNKDVWDNIDIGLQFLIKTDRVYKAILFLEHLLVHNNGELSIEFFDSLIHNLHGNSQSILNILATRWFLSKKVPLCRAVEDIVKLSHGNDIVLIADTEQFTKQPEGIRLFAARKAIGWLYINPVSATSFIVSLLDASSENEIEQITELLFDPLLISYSGKVKQYLDSLLPNQSTKVRGILTNALEKLENYHDGLKSARDIPELLPSQSQRETHSRLANRQMADARKKAEKTSILNSICSKSVLLYGRKSIHYIHGLDEQMHRQEMPLHSFSHSIEHSRLAYMDPHGLDYMLRVFRIEGCER
ncbi:MAG: hypothetical protein M0Q44_09175 [Methylobacter sp.]|nr:hypothetical protein [Methylobacter sp.]